MKGADRRQAAAGAGGRRWGVADVATPALVIDESIARRNMARLAAYAAGHGLGVRPHAKTHKSLLVARWQLEAGAVGLAVAKVGEAEVLSAVCDDLLIAYPVVDEPRCGRVAQLARRKTIRVAVDSTYAVDALAGAATRVGATVGVLVDLDVGFHRTGVQGPAAALELARRIDATDGVRLDGILCYPGQVTGPADEQDLTAVADLLDETLRRWADSHLEARIVSGGSTPTAYQSHRIPALTEIRPGTYVYNDMNTVVRGYCSVGDCAARVACTVVSEAVPGKVVIDAGTKALSSDRCAGGEGFGRVVEYPRARLVRLSEEHGEVDVSGCDFKPALGQRVHVIPNHVCPCVNLYDRGWLCRPDGRCEPLRIDARGMLS